MKTLAADTATEMGMNLSQLVLALPLLPLEWGQVTYFNLRERLGKLKIHWFREVHRSKVAGLDLGQSTTRQVEEILKAEEWKECGGGPVEVEVETSP